MASSALRGIVEKIEGASYEKHEARPASTKGPREKFLAAIDEQIELADDPNYKKTKENGKQVNPNKWFFYKGSKVHIQPRYGNKRIDPDHDIIVDKSMLKQTLQQLRHEVASGGLDDELEKIA